MSSQVKTESAFSTREATARARANDAGRGLRGSGFDLAPAVKLETLHSRD
jgi:hypothetical protein